MMPVWKSLFWFCFLFKMTGISSTLSSPKHQTRGNTIPRLFVGGSELSLERCAVHFSAVKQGYVYSKPGKLM